MALLSWLFCVLSFVCFLCAIVVSVYLLKWYRNRNGPQEDNMVIERVVLRRTILLTRTTQKTFIYNLCHIQDLISVLLSILGFSFQKVAKEHCSPAFSTFYTLFIIYQSATLVRIFCVVVFFRNGKSLWRCLKRSRCFSCLNLCEYEAIA